MNNSDFGALDLAAPLLRALDASGFTTPTPIQAAAIPPLLEGRDLIGLAQTGSGKTAAFALPLLQNLAEEGWRPAPTETSALILAPTRELAVQIHETFETLGKGMGLQSAVILGGVSRGPQEKRLAKGVHIVVGTPGRILDLMSTRHLSLAEVTDFVLDEADRMLDLGFVREVKKIVRALPKDRQTSMFSATWPSSVRALAADLLDDPVTVDAGERRAQKTPAQIEQRVIFVGDGSAQPTRSDALRGLFDDDAVTSAIVFTRTKRGANRVAAVLDRAGVCAAAIHGNKSQNARQRALGAFKAGEARALVATDIAARGIDIQGVSHVINFDMPVCAEDYVHRIGRTARAGASGVAISLCDGEEMGDLRAIEKLIGRTIAKTGPAPLDRERPKPSTPARRQPRSKPKAEAQSKPKNGGRRRRRKPKKAA